MEPIENIPGTSTYFIEDNWKLIKFPEEATISSAMIGIIIYDTHTKNALVGNFTEVMTTTEGIKYIQKMLDETLEIFNNKKVLKVYLGFAPLSFDHEDEDYFDQDKIYDYQKNRNTTLSILFERGLKISKLWDFKNPDQVLEMHISTQTGKVTYTVEDSEDEEIQTSIVERDLDQIPAEDNGEY